MKEFTPLLEYADYEFKLVFGCNNGKVQKVSVVYLQQH
jgi:hypothetical protein